MARPPGLCVNRATLKPQEQLWEVQITYTSREHAEIGDWEPDLLDVLGYASVRRDLADAREEIDRLRETNRRLNRRAQAAEAGVIEAAKTQADAGMSLGRGLANAAASTYLRERDDAREEIAHLKHRLDAALGQAKDAVEQYREVRAERDALRLAVTEARATAGAGLTDKGGPYLFRWGKRTIAERVLATLTKHVPALPSGRDSALDICARCGRVGRMFGHYSGPGGISLDYCHDGPGTTCYELSSRERWPEARAIREQRDSTKGATR